MEIEKSNSKNDDRVRHWTFLVYPESAPSDWIEILNSNMVKWVQSPLHDKDLNPDGTEKKAHWHILVLFDGKKSYNQVLAITKSLNAPIPKKVKSAQGLVRYMAHEDNPEKAQYNKDDIISHGGADLDSLVKISNTDRYVAIRQMIQFISDNNIMEFQDLIDYALMNNDVWFKLLCDNSSYMLMNYIKSQRHREKRKVNYQTGEVIE